MCGYKKIKIEYIMMAVAFASVVWSIFAGFRISRFQWLWKVSFGFSECVDCLIRIREIL